MAQEYFFLRETDLISSLNDLSPIAAGSMIYASDIDVLAETPSTAFGRALLNTADLAALDVILGLPSTSTDNTVPRFSGTAGALEGTLVQINDANAILVAAGTAALPGFSFVGDTNTGWSAATADTLVGSTAGSERIRITSGGLFGIGVTPSAKALLHVGNSTDQYAVFQFNNVGSYPTPVFGTSIGFNRSSGQAESNFINSYTSAVTSFTFSQQTGASAITDLVTFKANGLIGINPASILGGTPLFGLHLGQTGMMVESLAGAGSVAFRRFNGSIGTPTKVVSGNNIGGLNFGGYQETTGAFTTGVQLVLVTSSQDWTSTANGMEVRFSTVLNGTTNAQERLRIDNAGRVVMGHTTAIAINASSGTYPYFQRHGFSGVDDAAIVAYRWQAGAGPAFLGGAKSRSATAGSHSIVSVSDSLVQFAGYGDDGTDFIPAAVISVVVDAAPGTGDMPGRIVFATTADGFGTSTEAMRVDSAQRVLIGAALSATGTFEAGAAAPRFQLHGTSLATSSMGVSIYSNDAVGPLLYLAKSRNATEGSHTIVSSGDQLGGISFAGSNGTNFINAAQIIGFSAGTPGASNDMPGEIRIYTTPDTSGTALRRVTFGSTGSTVFGTNVQSVTQTHTVIIGGEMGGTPNLMLRPQGAAQSEETGISFFATFEGSGDNGPRRVVDVFAGFDGGTWGREYLAFGVGTSTAGSAASNDSAVICVERVRVTEDAIMKINGSARRGTTEGTNQLAIFNGTAPVGTLTNGASFYCASGEMRVMDSAGNSTLLSPHDHDTKRWVYHSIQTETKAGLRIEVEEMLRALNEEFGWDYVQDFDWDGKDQSVSATPDKERQPPIKGHFEALWAQIDALNETTKAQATRIAELEKRLAA